MNESGAFFYWITFEKHLDPVYFRLAAAMKERGVDLIPTQIDQLTRLMATGHEVRHVALVSTRNLAQYEAYVQQVQGLLWQTLKYDKITFFHLSSFETLNLSSKLVLSKRYFFIRYPLPITTLCDKITKYYQRINQHSLKWPGGKRSAIPDAG